MWYLCQYKTKRFLAVLAHLEIYFPLETTKLSATDLFDHCRNEIVDRLFIQPPAAMLSDEQRFKNIIAVMEGLLDHLAYLFSMLQSQNNF